MGGNRDDFSAKTKDIMAKQVAFRCSNPNCRKLTCGSGTKKDGVVNIGVAAHICAAAPGGKRYNPNMTKEQRMGIDNGIWLCQNCAKLIDSDENRFPVELLQGWKRQAQGGTRQELEFRLGEEDTRIQMLDALLIAIPKFEHRGDFLICETYLNAELDRLIEKMEELQRKLNMARITNDSIWSDIYERQFENTRLLFLEIDQHIERIREQASDVHKAIEDTEYLSEIIRAADGPKGVGLLFALLSCCVDFLLRKYGIVLLRKETKRYVNLMVDAWKMVEKVEVVLIECDKSYCNAFER